MGGFRHRSLYVEMKDRFGTTRALLGQPSPARVPHAHRAVTYGAVTDKIDIGVVLVGRPMPLEIIKESGPVRLEAMHLEIAQRELEAVFDANQRRCILGQPFD